MNPPVFGLHVGNSSASLAIYKEDGKIDVIANEIGERVTPAVVTILDNEKLVGSVAKSLLVPKWNCTVTDNKRLMNRLLSDSEKEEARLKTRVSTEYVNGDLCYSIPFEEKSEKYTPAQIATLIYKKLYDIAKSAVHAGEGDAISCVILVPTYFDINSIEHTKGAVENAGWTVLQMIKEPVAPILAYSLLAKSFNEKKQISDGVQCVNEGLTSDNETTRHQESLLIPNSQTALNNNNLVESCLSDVIGLRPAWITKIRLVLVYRLGGVSCEATVLRTYNGMVHILGTSYKDNIGASHLIIPLTNYLADEFFRKYKLDPKESPKSMGKLRQVAETCMHSLSNLNNANCFVESLYEGVDFKHPVSRARLETYLSPLLSIYTEPIHDVLQKTGLTTDLIQKVILCGGLMKIPKLQTHISGIFTNGEVLNGLLPDEVLAYGAAMQAGYLVSYKKLKYSRRKLKDKISDPKDSEHVEPMLPLTHPVELTDEHVEVRIIDHCNKEVQFDKYSVIPHHEKVYIDNFDVPEGEHRTFVFEVLIKGEKKHYGELTVTQEEDISYEIDVCLTVRKKLEIKFTTKNLAVNRRQTRIVQLKAVPS